MAELTEAEEAKLKVVTTVEFPCRASYVKIANAELNDLNGKMEFSLSVLIPKEAAKTLASLRQAATLAYKRKFGNAKMPPGFKNPLRDGDKVGGVALGGLPDGTEVGEKAEYDNHFFFNCKNTRPPVIKNQQNQTVLDDDHCIESGDYVRIICVAYGYDKKSKGCAFSLRGIQLIRT